ncbi:MAG: hypothetical protein AB7Q97_17545 [Gammaproteobacteria bacterium]
MNLRMAGLVALPLTALLLSTPVASSTVTGSGFVAYYNDPTNILGTRLGLRPLTVGEPFTISYTIDDAATPFFSSAGAFRTLYVLDDPTSSVQVSFAGADVAGIGVYSGTTLQPDWTDVFVGNDVPPTFHPVTGFSPLHDEWSVLQDLAEPLSGQNLWLFVRFDDDPTRISDPSYFLNPTAADWNNLTFTILVSDGTTLAAGNLTGQFITPLPAAAWVLVPALGVLTRIGRRRPA